MSDATPQSDAADKPLPARPLPLDYEAPRSGDGSLSGIYTRTEKAFLWCALASPVLIGMAGLVDNEVLSPVLGVLAAVVWFVALGLLVVGIAERRDPWRRSLPRLFKGLMLLALPSLCVGGIFVPHTSRPREPNNRVKCASNLRLIGLAAMIYANENNGSYPASPEAILLTQEIGAEVFCCPSTNDFMAPGTTPQQVAANLSTGSHLSYVYLGKGLTAATVGATTVLAYEPLKNHNNKGLNVLYGDRRVVWLDKREAQHLIDELAAGRNPPRAVKSD